MNIDVDEEKKTIDVLDNKDSTVLQLLMRADVVNMKNNDKVTKFFDPKKMWELLRYAYMDKFGLNEQEYKELKIDEPRDENIKKIPYVSNELLKAESIMEIILSEHPYEAYCRIYPCVPLSPKKETASIKKEESKEAEVKKEEPPTEKIPPSFLSASMILRSRGPATTTLSNSSISSASPLKEETKELSSREDITSYYGEEKPFCFIDFYLNIIRDSSIKIPTIAGYYYSSLNNFITCKAKIVFDRINELKLIDLFMDNIDKLSIIDCLRALMQVFVENKEELQSLRNSILDKTINLLQPKNKSKTKLQVKGAANFYKALLDYDIVELPNIKIESIIEIYQESLNDSEEAVCCADILLTYIGKIKPQKQGEQFNANKVIFNKTIELLEVNKDKMKYIPILKLLIAYLSCAKKMHFNEKEDAPRLKLLGVQMLSLFKVETSSVLLVNLLQLYHACFKKFMIQYIFTHELIEYLAEFSSDKEASPKYPIACEIIKEIKKAKCMRMYNDKLPPKIKQFYSTYVNESEKPLCTEQYSCTITKNDAIKAYYEVEKMSLVNMIHIEDNDEELYINEIC